MNTLVYVCFIVLLKPSVGKKLNEMHLFIGYNFDIYHGFYKKKAF